MNLAKITGKLKEQIRFFSGKVSTGLPKAARRFVEEMLYGIASEQSVHLSKIGRSLSERIPLIKTINRLSFELSRPGLWEKLTLELLKLAGAEISADTLLVLDLSDIAKPYAREMEYLGRVRDGSRGELTDGYWTCQVIATELGRPEIIPLYNRLYSLSAPDCTGENEEIFKAMDMVSREVNNRGIWVIDRGADRRIIFDHLLSRQRRFIIRLKGDRFVLRQGKKIIVSDLAVRCVLPYSQTLVWEEREKETAYDISFGFCRVYLPDIPLPLGLVVVKGFGEEPMMLLTNLPLKKNRQLLLKIVKSYITRWGIEETIRFVKQSYKVEDIRVQTYVRLQNMMALVLAAAFFAAVHIGGKLKLVTLSAIIIKASKRIFGVAAFRYYAIADGIKELLSRNKTGPIRPNPPWIPKNQLKLFSP
jgi:hypothetical protein